jgi:hypothetical protein
MSAREEEGLVLYPDIAHAFVGLMARFSALEPVACYDFDAVIAGYVEEGMTEEEALEHFEYNVIGAWVGERTPCFLRRISLEQAIEEAEAE